MQQKLQTPSGSKAHQRSDFEDRSAEFRRWHRTLDRSMLASDVDLIEWRSISGDTLPVAVIEITRIDQGRKISEAYLNAITQRFQERDFQAKAANYVAKKLGVKAWIVLYRQGCNEFWVYDLTQTRRWYPKDIHVPWGRSTFGLWLAGLERIYENRRVVQ